MGLNFKYNHGQTPLNEEEKDATMLDRLRNSINKADLIEKKFLSSL